MPNPIHKSPVALDQLLCERLEAVVAEQTGGPFARPRVSLAVREVLEAGQLSRAEEQLLELNKLQGHAGEDLLELSIAARVERALTAGLEAALGSADPDSLGNLPHIVVRRAGTGCADFELPAPDAPTTGEQVLILTDAQGLQQLESSPTVERAGVEVVEIDELQGLADRLGAQLSGAVTAPRAAFATATDTPLDEAQEPGGVGPPSLTNRVLTSAAVVLLLVGAAWIVHLALQPATETQAHAPLPILEVESVGPDGLALAPSAVRTFVADPDDPDAPPGNIRLAVKAALEPSDIELVRREAAGDVAVEGLIPEWGAGHVDIRVARPGGRQSWDSVCLKLTDQGRVQYSEAMRFAHVGRDAWRFGSMAIPIPGGDDLALRPDEDVSLDPRGLRLLVALEWTAPDGAEDIDTLVAEPRVRADGSDWVATRFHERRAGGAWYAIDLDQLALTGPEGGAGGPARVEVEARDVSGNLHHTTFGLQAITTPLELTGFSVRDRDQNEPPRNERREYVISSRSPNIRISGTFSREVAGSVAVQDQGSDFTRSAPVRGRGLASTLDLSAGEDYSGSIRVTARDLVPHADLHRAAHRIEYEAPFEYTTKEATFAAALKVGDETYELTPGGAIITSAEEGLLWVQSRSGIPARVQVSVTGPGASVTPEWTAIDTSSEGNFVLRLASDGHATVRIQSFRTDHGRAEMDESYKVLRDSRAPELAFDADTILLRKGDGEPELHLWVDRLDEERIGTPVELHDWRVRRLDGRADLPLAEPLPVSAQPRASVWLRLPRVYEDGTYELSVRARDAVGNETEEPAVLRWEVARKGPVVRPEYPEGIEWRPQEGRYRVAYEIEDPNGIRGTAHCRVRALSGSLPDKVMPLTQGPDARWEGECRFTHEWSGQSVELTVEVEDAHGNSGDPSPRQHSLPTIALEYPTVVAMNGRRADAIGSMRIVETAGLGAYAFKGREDKLENELFERAGLPPYASRGEQRSWSILYAAGEIPPFYLDEHEVTNAQYLAFMRATGAGGPPYLKEVSLAPAGAELPVVGVTWDEADAYARWVGKRLPSYVEWEYALRGGSRYRPYSSWVEGRTPPSGDEINVADPSAPAASYAPWPRGRGRDVTPEGIWNLSGNVSEWTSSPFYFDKAVRTQPSNLKQHATENRHRYLAPDSDSAPEFWIAGGCYRLRGYHFARNDQRERGVRLDTVGFRCASDADEVMMGLEGNSPRFVSMPAEEER